MTRSGSPAPSDQPLDFPFTECGLLEYLQADNRLVLVVDALAVYDSVSIKDDCFIFYNNSLLADRIISSRISGLLAAPISTKQSTSDEVLFQSLVTGACSDSVWAWNVLWSVAVVGSRWRIVSGAQLPQSLRSSTPVSGEPIPPSDDSQPTHSSGTDLEPRNLVHESMRQASAHLQQLQTFQWANTNLGPVSSWPEALCQIVRYSMANPTPGVILWGPERTMVYNDAYIKLIRDLHPAALGQPAADVFKEFWPYYEQICREVESTGRAVSKFKALGPVIEEDGSPRETFFTYHYFPILDDQGKVCGIYDQCFEATSEVYMEVRIDTLLRLNGAMNTATDLTSFWKAIFGEFKNNAADFPLAAVYSIGNDALIEYSSEVNVEHQSDLRPSDQDKSFIHCPGNWVLEGSIGFPDGHPWTPPVMSMLGSNGLSAMFRQAGASPKLQNSILSMTDGSIASDLLDGRDNHGLGLQCSQLTLCPLRHITGGIIAWLVLGVNPRRIIDDEYRDFTELLTRHVESMLALILTFEREKRRALKDAEDAAYQQERMSVQLQQRIREARESDLRFIRFAMNSPIGVYVLGPNGETQFCNEAWRNLVGIEPGTIVPKAWRSFVHPDDKEKVDLEWQRLLDGHIQKSFEWRVLRPDSVLNGESGDIVYLQSSSFPEMAEDGTLNSVTGLAVDMSIQKAYQRSQSEKLADALEAKRAQEYFMDMVSHEMRNPLNAIIQCAEEAIDLLGELSPDISHGHGANHAVRNLLEAVNTIHYCGIHQKQLIDDVLTVSKLDANLLTVSPVIVNPTSLLKQATKIYDTEIRATGIKLFTDFGNIDRDHHTNHNVMVDTSRILQILINLISNAIKFLKGRDRRELYVSVHISRQRPLVESIHFIPSGGCRPDPTSGLEWGTGEVVYLYFSVRDTGIGLTDSEMRSLFARFQQASPRTHVTYGGSGLGLFISRELAELHGGEIGLASQVDQGSTFAFYVKGRRSTHMASPRTDIQPSMQIVRPQRTQSDGRPTTTQDTLPTIENQPTSPASEQKEHVLVVEDNEINQKVLKRQLQKLGYVVTTANHGGEALTILQNSSWWHDNQPQESNGSHTKNPTAHLAIILCDLEMPIMDGKACVRQIRDWQQAGLLHPHIPVIAVTGNAGAERTLTSAAFGFDDVVSKPYSIESLVKRMSTLIQQRSETPTSPDEVT